MTQHDKDVPETMRKALAGYNEPPKLRSADFDAMWSGIEEASFRKPFATPSADWGGVRGRGIVRTLLPMAAVLLIGVAIGRFTVPATRDATQTAVAVRLDLASAPIPEPYQSTTSRYLGQAAALLVALPSEVRSGDAAEPYRGRAHDLLLTTRLLLDSPAAGDPRFRTLLEDLELVLAQVVRLQSAESSDELELIRQALEQRDVLPRLRTAAADISADD